MWATGDHPRIRGEHFSPICTREKSSGSSPHTRGARRRRRARLAATRIIPAYAGSTRRRGCRRRRHADHPRIRGEHRRHPICHARQQGSSPHTRGAPRRGAVPWRQPRIIPAYAGSTELRESSGCLGQDHPRIRGEHVFEKVLGEVGQGSSPHTRGARCRARRRVVALRIIPAYAGSTRRRGCRRRRRADHPRIRGEHVCALRASVLILGSSPHTRGARGPGRRGAGGARIIPAYAGSTCGGLIDARTQ